MTDPHLTPRQPSVSRREALQALAAAGGALGAAFLPARWGRPLIEAGVLPAHAQSSNCLGPFTLTGCPINTIAWDPMQNQSFMLNITFQAQIDPPCAGIGLCYQIRWLFGDQVVDQNEIFCGQTGPGGLASSGGGISEGLFFQMQPTPNTCEVVVSFENPQLGQDVCTSTMAIPPYPED